MLSQVLKVTLFTVQFLLRFYPQNPKISMNPFSVWVPVNDTSMILRFYG